MNVYNWKEIDSFSQTEYFSCGTGVSVGSFDGLHLGHRVLLEELVNCCRNLSVKSGIITFLRPLPAIKHSDDYTGDISTLSQRLRLFEQLGISFVIVVDFDEQFASLKGTEFLSILKQKLNMKFLAEGIDFRCGYKGATDTQAIKYWAQQNNVECSFVDPVYYTEADGEQERVSSSYIRRMIQKGFFSTVTELLARPYELDLEELHNTSDAKSIDITQILPPDGIYRTQSEKNELVRLEIKDGCILDTPDCIAVKFC